MEPTELTQKELEILVRDTENRLQGLRRELDKKSPRALGFRVTTVSPGYIQPLTDLAARMGIDFSILRQEVSGSNVWRTLTYQEFHKEYFAG